MNSSSDVDELCTRFHQKILKIGCCRAKRNLPIFQLKKVDFLPFLPTLRFLKDLLLKIHTNLLFYLFQDFSKMMQKIKNLTRSSVNNYFEVFRFNFWANLEKKWMLCKSVNFAYKRAQNELKKAILAKFARFFGFFQLLSQIYQKWRKKSKLWLVTQLRNSLKYSELIL